MKFVIFLIGTCLSLKIYRSSLPIGKSGLSGLKYVHSGQNLISTNSLTVCGRFNYKRLGGESVIFDLDKNLAVSFLWLTMGYPYTWVNFGNFETDHIASTSYILKDPKTDEFSIWYTNKWHHICFAYDAKTSHIAFVKVSYFFQTNEQTFLIY